MQYGLERVGIDFEVDIDDDQTDSSAGITILNNDPSVGIEVPDDVVCGE